MKIRRVLSITVVFVVAIAFLFSSHFNPSRIYGTPSHVHAQFGATVPLGFAAGATNFAPLTTTTGAAGTVTNTSTFLMEVDGGPVWCFGGQDQIPEDNIFLFANTTFLIVYNCAQNTVYAKTAVTGPGTLSPNQPGVPATLLTPANGEVPLANVVCGASTCATITDVRPLAAFPVAHMLPQSTFANLPATYPQGAMVICSSCTALAAGATCTSGAGQALALRFGTLWKCY
jgi:hypothetical protein